MAHDAAGGVGGVEGRVDQVGVTVLGDLASAVDGDRVWMACTCGAEISQIREPYRPALAARCLSYGLPECSKGGLGLAHQMVRFAPR